MNDQFSMKARAEFTSSGNDSRQNITRTRRESSSVKAAFTSGTITPSPDSAETTTPGDAATVVKRTSGIPGIITSPDKPSADNASDTSELIRTRRNRPALTPAGSSVESSPTRLDTGLGHAENKSGTDETQPVVKGSNGGRGKKRNPSTGAFIAERKSRHADGPVTTGKQSEIFEKIRSDMRDGKLTSPKKTDQTYTP